MKNLVVRLFFLTALVVFSGTVIAQNSLVGKVTDSGADFSLGDEISATVFLENPAGKARQRIQLNNDFGYKNSFESKARNKAKWNIEFDRTGRADVLRVVIVFENAFVTGNSVVSGNYEIFFEDAIAQGFDVSLENVGRNAEVSIQGFAGVNGIVVIDPLVLLKITDDFTGANGSAWNSDIWTESFNQDPNGGNAITIQSNEGRMVVERDAGSAGVATMRYTDPVLLDGVGDTFKFQIDMKTISETANSRVFTGIASGAQTEANGNFSFYANCGSKDTQGFYNSAGALIAGATCENTTVTIAVDRNGTSDLNLSGWVDGTPIVTNYLISTGDSNFFFALHAKTVDGGAGDTATANWDNFYAPVYLDLNVSKPRPQATLIDVQRIDLRVKNTNTDFNTTDLLFDINLVQDSNVMILVDDANNAVTNNFICDSNNVFSYITCSYLTFDTRLYLDGDYNITAEVIVSDGNHFTDSTNGSFTIANQSHSINDFGATDINFALNDFLNNVDVNFGAKTFGTINYIVWGGTDFDVNLTGTSITKTFTSEGTKEVCVITNGIGDLNNILCKDFEITRFLVRKPLDEQNFTELTPFTVIGSSPIQNFTGSNDLNLFAFFEESQDFRINVDYNASYYPRNYFFDLNASTHLFELQPYLALTTKSIQSVIFTIDNLTRTTVPGILVESYKDVNGTLTLIESGISDASGTVAMTFLTEPTYQLYFIRNGELLSSGDLVAKSTTLYAFIFTGVISSSPPALPKINVKFFPLETSVSSDADNNTFLNQIISFVDTNVTNVIVSISSNDINVFYKDFNSLGSSDWNIAYDFNTSDVNSYSFLNVQVLVVTETDGSYSFTKSYIIVLSGGQNFLNNLKNVKSELGNTSVLILSILITLGIVSFVALRITTDPAWIGLLAIFITGFFVYISWLSFSEWVVAALGGIALMFWSWRK